MGRLSSILKAAVPLVGSHPGPLSLIELPPLKGTDAQRTTDAPWAAYERANAVAFSEAAANSSPNSAPSGPLTPSRFLYQCSRESWGTVRVVCRRERGPVRRHTTRCRRERPGGCIVQPGNEFSRGRPLVAAGRFFGHFVPLVESP